MIFVSYFVLYNKRVLINRTGAVEQSLIILQQLWQHILIFYHEYGVSCCYISLKYYEMTFNDNNNLALR